MSGNAHVRCEAGENPEMISKDYLSLFPKLEGAEMLFSAARSRRLGIVALVQGLVQLEKNYGREGAQVIRDNCQLTIFGGFAPGSESADTLSRDLGHQTVLSGSVSKGKESSRSLQMMGRALMTPDELKAMPKGSFITMKTGMHPMKTKFRLFLEWGIRFGKPLEMAEQTERRVIYAGREELEKAIMEKYAIENPPPVRQRKGMRQKESVRPRTD